jgi:hypothetical protein
MKKVKVLLLVSAVLAATASTPGVSYASAKDDMTKSITSTRVAAPVGKDACDAGAVCLWTGPNYTGYMLAWGFDNYSPDFTTLRCLPIQGCGAGNFNDDASSWYNHSGKTWCVSEHRNGGGRDNTMPVGTYGDFTPEWQNIASSIGYLGCP